MARLSANKISSKDKYAHFLNVCVGGQKSYELPVNATLLEGCVPTQCFFLENAHFCSFLGGGGAGYPWESKCMLS